jgi:hypothetical protein
MELGLTSGIYEEGTPISSTGSYSSFGGINKFQSETVFPSNLSPLDAEKYAVNPKSEYHGTTGSLIIL